VKEKPVLSMGMIKIKNIEDGGNVRLVAKSFILLRP
jgi:hypothetical protein